MDISPDVQTSALTHLHQFDAIDTFTLLSLLVVIGFSIAVIRIMGQVKEDKPKTGQMDEVLKRRQLR